MAQAGNKQWRFCPPPYPAPNYAFYDLIRWAPQEFSTAEFFVLLFLAERTLSWGHTTDTASVNQMSHGIYSLGKNEWIRGTCGLKKTAVKQAIRSLERKGVLICRRSLPGESRYNPQQGNAPTEYEINWGTLHALFRTCEKAPLGRKPTKPLGHRATEPLGRGATHNNRESSSKRTVYKREEVNPSPHMRSVVEDGWKRSAQPVGSRSTAATNEAPPATIDQAKKELAQLVQERGKVLSARDWQDISEELELKGIGLPEFVAHIRPHLRNSKVHNPIGLIKHHIQHFRALQREAVPNLSDAPINTVAPDEKCPICQQTQGQGSRVVDGLFEPCECANDEWRSEVNTINAALQARHQIAPNVDQDS